METHYTGERSIGILLSLMKSHDVRKVIASPGSTNITLVASMQQDSYFEMYSAPDERSAAYMACGLSAESKEPVAISCTGATASRNYVPGLTEAYYRKLPVLAITSSQHIGQVGQYIPQVIDRSVLMNDIANLSVQVPIIHDEMDAWATNVAINKALLELRHRGGGPVHINLQTSYPFYPIDFSVKELSVSRVINRVEYGDERPELTGKNIAIFVGNHEKMDTELIRAIDEFCEKYNAVVLCDQTSNYTGEYGVSASLVTSQDMYRATCLDIDVLIHIGQVSGAYLNITPKQVWRVNPDGEIRDVFHKLKYVFEMRELDFFKEYSIMAKATVVSNSYYAQWQAEYQSLLSKVSELPLSNIWMAQKLADRIPSGSTLYLGILNSLRAWNFCKIRKDITGYSNTGGFGIDGGLSSLVGGALNNRNVLHFEILGDLAFFYDMNVLGNHHLSATIRILLINNGKGTEFRNYTHFASEFGDEADKFIAAGGHYGNKSPNLVKHYAEDLGFRYLSAKSKDEFETQMDIFCSPNITEQPILFEVFTDNIDENNALKTMRTLNVSKISLAKQMVKNVAKETLGNKGFNKIKKMIKV
ncbi:thiamine pyrophosphate-binding protein [Eisenbergiella porci]|uniref:thiamine pyrophosphate-binding protein n=1 Tax=Eisenbergiella porci TaxID=2652274 RepID=UPI002A82ABA4|nr:thiamine pyrophosphate-binding protein [Eisenbergiella porci]